MEERSDAMRDCATVTKRVSYVNLPSASSRPAAVCLVLTISMFLSRVSTLTRLCAQNLTRRGPAFRPRNVRCLTSTPIRRASEPAPPNVDPKTLEALKDLSKSEAFQKIFHDAEALETLGKLSQIVRDSGADIGPGKAPSMLQMSKLLMNSEFRKCAQELTQHFQRLGIDLNDKVRLRSLSNKASQK
ncbi:hypothetical protein CVT26_008545 [Gymnopilus dilepis]|uniref:Uncharacterized protein n=1 Tax=Gymnopilus dilepis TaxID=231916 RepID=A0A409XXM8_9AGAR|nr:hypothetical protein CVT26_008545 [Gymnopilus dilepis]